MLRTNINHNEHDADPIETGDWLASLEAVHRDSGPERATYLLARLHQWATRHGVVTPFSANTPYVNTIPRTRQARFPGDRAIERRIKSYVRWNAMAMVVRANKQYDGIGGHISTFASAATLLEVGFNHFFRAKNEHQTGDQILIQGHSSPGVYARAYLEGRLTAQHLHNFRREFSPGGGLSSYPHPWLMPEFWEFPTVSMGLASITAIYQARFNRYLADRGLLDTNQSRVWAFLGDGETDEPESLGAITLASREQLDNLTFVINCNLQRLDGPVRGNGNIIQELEAAFRGAGWNVIKVIWGADWDPLIEADTDGMLVDRMNHTVDGQWQRYSAENGAYIREHFFGADPKMQQLVANLSDTQIEHLRLGGHDPEKVYAAYKAATEHKGQPTVILARTIKGYGTGEAGEGRNVTHQQKKLNEQEMKQFRDRFDIPISDKEIKDAPFCRFEKGSAEYDYLMERRGALGGFVPHRRVGARPLEAPGLDAFEEFLSGSGEGKKASTTMAFMRMLARMLRMKPIADLIVPIVPDEARTFGMEALFRTSGIYAHAGQLYEPVDAHLLLKYEERKNGQILEEGITEAGSMASFTAAGTAYATFGLNTIPFFIYYSMFGFQRIGDSIWAAGDMRCKGFLLGGTAGRTTLNGEGLQHQDGHSHLHASTVPNCVAYDPAFAFELAVIIQDGIRRMYEKREDIFYYITLYNEQYEMPQIPKELHNAAAASVTDAILHGMYKYRQAQEIDAPKAGPLAGKKDWLAAAPRIHLFGSGPILLQALAAQELLRDKFGVAADVWSVTSYNELYRECLATGRWNRLHPDQPKRLPYFVRALGEEKWPIVAASDYVKAIPHRLVPWAPNGMYALGTDGFGRSDTREALREHFEIDPRFIAYSALGELAKIGKFDGKKLPEAMKLLEINPEKAEPMYA